MADRCCPSILRRSAARRVPEIGDESSKINFGAFWKIKDHSPSSMTRHTSRCAAVHARRNSCTANTVIRCLSTTVTRWIVLIRYQWLSSVLHSLLLPSHSYGQHVRKREEDEEEWLYELIPEREDHPLPIRAPDHHLTHSEQKVIDNNHIPQLSSIHWNQKLTVQNHLKK